MTTIKTIKAFAAASYISESLIRAVIRQSGGWDNFKEMSKNVTLHGANAGFYGFTYYDDTVSFAERNKTEIVTLLKQSAEMLGECSYLDVLSTFNCFKGYTKEEILEGFFDKQSDSYHVVYNALAWFALEEVSNAYVQAIDE